MAKSDEKWLKVEKVEKSVERGEKRLEVANNGFMWLKVVVCGKKWLCMDISGCMWL